MQEERVFTGGKLLVCLVILLISIGLLFVGSVEAVLVSDGISIESFMLMINIPYEEIESIETVEGLDPGTRLTGVGNLKIESGRYENELLGRYRLYACKKNPLTIVLYCSDDEIIAFNVQTREETEKLYDGIKEAMDNR